MFRYCVCAGYGDLVCASSPLSCLPHLLAGDVRGCPNCRAASPLEPSTPAPNSKFAPHPLARRNGRCVAELRGWGGRVFSETKRRHVFFGQPSLCQTKRCDVMWKEMGELGWLAKTPTSGCSWLHLLLFCLCVFCKIYFFVISSLQMISLAFFRQRHWALLTHSAREACRAGGFGWGAAGEEDSGGGRPVWRIRSKRQS